MSGEAFPITKRAIQASHGAGHPPLSAGAVARMCKAEREYNEAYARLLAAHVARRPERIEMAPRLYDMGKAIAELAP